MELISQYHPILKYEN